MNTYRGIYALFLWANVWLVSLLILGGSIQPVTAQTATSEAEIEAAGDRPHYPLQIQLRYSDGTAVTGEPLSLERLPQAIPMACVTDDNGRCTWWVGRGLYQLLFERPLDQISALSLAEGGLRGFGLTVGEAAITYHFTFQPDGHAYFDAAPEAAVPEPILPQFHSLQGGTMPLLEGTTAEATMPLSQTATPATPEPEIVGSPTLVGPTSDNPGPLLLLLLGLGILLGGSVHLLQQRWSSASPQEAPRPQRTNKWTDSNE